MNTAIELRAIGPGIGLITFILTFTSVSAEKSMLSLRKDYKNSD